MYVEIIGNYCTVLRLLGETEKAEKFQAEVQFLLSERDP
jgi:hypothetical protein